MKKTILATLVAAGFAGQVVADNHDELSYMLGYDIGQRIGSLGLDEVNSEEFIAGLEAAMAGNESRLTDEQVQAATAMITELQQAAMEAQRAELAAAAQANQTEGEEFLAENANKDGVMVTDSGLQYEVIEMGDGPKPAATDEVTVHYRGTTLDGEEFDSSFKRNAPATFALNRVIKGWTEGLQLMPAGSKFKFYIPADLAYGGRGSPPNIGPNSTLIFDVELLEVKGAEG